MDESERRRLQEFPAFVDWVTSRDPTRGDTHLRLQCCLVDLNRIDFLGRFESFEEDFARVCRRLGLPSDEVPHRNRSEHAPYRSYYDDKTVERVGNFYERDVRLFGYRF